MFGLKFIKINSKQKKSNAFKEICQDPTVQHDQGLRWSIQIVQDKVQQIQQILD